MADLTTSLPNLSAEYSISADEIARFRHDGHVVLRGVCSPAEIAVYRPLIVAAAQRHGDTVHQDARPLAERPFLQTSHIWGEEEGVRRFVLATRFAKIAADLIGADAVRLYQDQALFKEAGGGPTPWHVDQVYWPLDKEVISMWMPLVDVSEEMGTMLFASGSHREAGFRGFDISDESEVQVRRLVEERGLRVTGCGAMAAGDASFHAGLILHRAPGNSTGITREVMGVVYYPDGTRLIEPDSPHQVRAMERWFPGRKPGELAVSDQRPLVYSR
jgi:ectoine hydroxylase-related dioxygenase (phytanoyl-CoA dioxygenase family)